MNLDEIREIIKTDGGKFIIVENGKPVLVITSFEDYKKRIRPPSKEANPGPSQGTPESTPEEELTIDDLPF